MDCHAPDTQQQPDAYRYNSKHRVASATYTEPLPTGLTAEPTGDVLAHEYGMHLDHDTSSVPQPSRGTRARVLVTGATGFVGSHLMPLLARAGAQVIGGTRDVDRARRDHPTRDFVQFDLQRPETVSAALAGCTHAVYLVHGMGTVGQQYERTEREAALTFREAAAAAGLRRIVYLGGMRPAGTPSRHLRSRLATGECLREGSVSTIELQATMVIGSGSESFRMVRDLAARLPLMLLPRWLETRTQPIGIADVVYAIVRALRMDGQESRAFSLPGPETLSARAIIERTAGLLGRRPYTIAVPIVTPWLSTHWIRLVTRTHPHVAAELVEGLRTDILSPDEGFWLAYPGHRRQSFDEAVRAALAGEAEELSRAAVLLEEAAEWLTPKSDPAAATS
jgi:uncharacterized protein YbjT (DUF2867 family)